MNEAALLISFENQIDEQIHEQVLRLHALLNENPFPGFTEAVPSYCSLAVFYDPSAIRITTNQDVSAFILVKNLVEALISEIGNHVSAFQGTHFRIPVLYNGEDLKQLTEEKKIAVGDLIAIHCERQYRVYLLGFLPGFPYLGKLDDRLETERLSTPRTKVEAGSVGIAGFQTGIYPVASPGGWKIVGRTPLRIFDPHKDQPCLLHPGDTVSFCPISPREFELLNEY